MNEPVHQQLNGWITTRYLGEEQVRGKRETVRVYGVPEAAIP
jgi:hypothetical protein